MADFLNLGGRTFLVFGVANRRSVAWATVLGLEAQGAKVVLSVRSTARRDSLKALVGDRPVFICDVEQEGAVERLAAEVKAAGHAPLQGIVHSIAFAPEAALGGNFLNTEWTDVATAVQVSTFSLKSLAVACLPLMQPGSAIVGFDFDAAIARHAIG